jgi:lipid II:glycine glycyltransferase (peptidoglycan interpeptide bridge formation enzyme)
VRYINKLKVKNEKLKIEEADLAVCDEADSFLQSAMWGRFKARFGWKAQAFIVNWEHGGEKPLLVLSRRIAPGFSMAYVPWGPELPCDSLPKTEAIVELASALRSSLPRSTAFIRFDPPWQIRNEKVEIRNEDRNPNYDIASGFSPNISNNNHHFSLLIPHFSFERASADIQPPDTVLIDLTLSPDDILAAMKPKWRYNIGLAEKRGVVVSETGTDGLDTFYKLLTETASRDGIAIHSIEYYRALFEECQRTQTTISPIHCSLFTVHCSLKLYTATHENDILAAIVVLFRGTTATYLYGASSNVKRNLMAPYALQWKAMQDARASGCTQYDMFGIPPNEDPDHPMAGLYRFKTGFGGKIIHRPGSWDYPCKPLLYTLFRCAEGLRKKVRDSRKR